MLSTTIKTLKRSYINLLFLILLTPSLMASLALKKNNNVNASYSSFVKGEVLIKFRQTALNNNVTTNNTGNTNSVLTKVTKGLKNAKIKLVGESNHQKSVLNSQATTLSQSKFYKLTFDPSTSVIDAIKQIQQNVGTDIEYIQPNYLMKPYQVVSPKVTLPSNDTSVIPVTPLTNDFYIDPYLTGKWSKGTWKQDEEDMWGLKLTNTLNAWELFQNGSYPVPGEGIVVGVIDSGVDYNHPDIWERIWVNPKIVGDNNSDGEVNLNDVDSNQNRRIEVNEIIPHMFGWDFGDDDQDPQDKNGHGTHVAGTIAATINNEQGIVGVAPGAKIMILKGFSDSGQGLSDRLAEAIRYAADNGAKVINNSWGCTSNCPSNPIVEEAVEYAKARGTIAVFAAGNSNVNTYSISPQNQWNTITVGASIPDDSPASFTNFGTVVDIMAPGGGSNDVSNVISPVYNVLSLLSEEHEMPEELIVKNDFETANYLRLAGTSMAAPHVTGVVALMLARNPNLDYNAIKQTLRSSATKTEYTHYAYGRLDAFNAVERVFNKPCTAKITSPSTQSLFKSGQIKIRGELGDYQCETYKVSLSSKDRPDDTTPLREGQAPIGDDILAEIEIESLELNKEYYITLEVKNQANQTFEDRIVIKRTNFIPGSLRLDIIDRDNYYAFDPKIHVASDQDIHLLTEVSYELEEDVWQRELIYAYSSDQGQTFRHHILDANVSQNVDLRPVGDIHSFGSHVFITWLKPTTEPLLFDLMLSISNDDGKSFATPIKVASGHGFLHSDSYTERGLGSQILIEGNKLHIFWVDFDEANKKRRLMHRVSDDFGKTFLNTKQLSESSFEYKMDRWHSKVGFNILFHNDKMYLEDYYKLIQRDANGNSWSLVNENIFSHTPIAHRTIMFPRMDIDSNGKMYIVFAHDKSPASPEDKIEIMRSDDNGKTFSNPIIVDDNVEGFFVDGIGFSVADNDTLVIVNATIPIYGGGNLWMNTSNNNAETFTKSSLTDKIIESFQGAWTNLSINSSGNNLWLVRDWYHHTLANRNIRLVGSRIDLEQAAKRIDLNEGWNLISIPVKPEDNSPESVFSSLDNNFEKAQTYVASDPQHDYWKSYSANKSPWVKNDLVEITPYQGYWVKVKKPTRFYVIGSLEKNPKIPLSKGWNMIGYPSLTKMKTKALIEPILQKTKTIYQYNAFDKKWKSYHNRFGGIGALQEMEAGYGYWYYATEPAILSFDK